MAGRQVNSDNGKPALTEAQKNSAQEPTGDALLKQQPDIDPNIGETEAEVEPKPEAAAGAGMSGGAGEPPCATRSIPFGFASSDDFGDFVRELREGLADAGFGEADIAFQGSSVTGEKFTTGRPFGPWSDFDIALAGADIFGAARDASIPLRGKGTRTGPLTETDLYDLGLFDLLESLNTRAGRDVAFMIYDSIDRAMDRSPSMRC